MAQINVLANLNMNQNEFLYPRIHALGSAPGSPTPVEGQMYMNTTDHKLYYHNGTTWVDSSYTWTIAADTGSSAVANGTTITMTGGTGITTSYATNAVTFALNIDELTASSGLDDTDEIAVDDAVDGVRKTTLAALKTYINAAAGTFSSFDVTGDSGGPKTINDAETVDFTGGTGIVTTVSGASSPYLVTFDLDFTELTDMTGNVAGTTEIILNNAGVESRKAINEITLSTFNIDIASTALTDTANIVYTNAARTISANHTIATGFHLTITDAPTSGTDAANKAYVDSVAQGLNPKDSVRVATTANGTFTTAFANGQTVDGITLATNDRILIKNQSTQSQNGIYIVQASGSPVRASDANAWDELVSAFVFVEVGTTNADTGWVCTSDQGGTLETTAVTWAQFSGAGTYTDGNGLTLTGNVFALGTPSTLTGATTNGTTASSHTHAITTGITDNSIVGIDSTTVASGEYARFTTTGLESRSASEVRADLVVPSKFAVDLNSAEGSVSRANAGGVTTFTVTHNLNTTDVNISVKLKSTGDVVWTEWTPTAVNTADVLFNDAGNTNDNLYRVVIIG